MKGITVFCADSFRVTTVKLGLLTVTERETFEKVCVSTQRFLPYAPPPLSRETDS